MKIDAHQHFWNYSAEEYGWIDDTMLAIRHDFLPTDLSPILAQAGIDGSIAVQARQNLTETNWLIDLANHHSIIKGVVGWVPLRDQGGLVGESLDRYLEHKVFKGVRHVLQGEEDSYFSDIGFNAGIREVTKRELIYDLLVFGRQLPVAISLVKKHPCQSFVLDHIAKPAIEGPPDPVWVKNIREISRHEHVYCKFSGVVTEVTGRQWTNELLLPYFEIILEAFGPKRLMFGSDWPVCLVATDYLRWYDFVKLGTSNLSPSEQTDIMGDNAINIYNL